MQRKKMHKSKQGIQHDRCPLLIKNDENFYVLHNEPRVLLAWMQHTWSGFGFLCVTTSAISSKMCASCSGTHWKKSIHRTMQLFVLDVWSFNTTLMQRQTITISLHSFHDFECRLKQKCPSKQKKQCSYESASCVHTSFFLDYPAWRESDYRPTTFRGLDTYSETHGLTTRSKQYCPGVFHFFLTSTKKRVWEHEGFLFCRGLHRKIGRKKRGWQ